MNTTNHTWPTTAERVVLWHMLLVTVLIGGLYLSGQLDSGSARVGAFAIWVCAVALSIRATRRAKH